MAGSNSNISTLYAYQFAQLIQLKLQQKGSRLRQAVMSGSHAGSQASPVDQFGVVAANRVNGRYQPMYHVDAPTDRRWVFPVDYDLPQLLDSFDKLRLIVDPMGPMGQNAAYAIERAMDNEIIAGVTGTNYTGQTGATSTTLPSAQVVTVQQGAASSTNLTVAKLRKAKQLLMAAEVDLDVDPLYCAVNATNHDNLLSEVQVVSTEFNEKPVLVEGKITRFLGINFIHTELLTTGTDDQSGTSTIVPVWAKSGMYLGVWEDVFTHISQRNDLQGIPWQVYLKSTFGATRLEEKKVVQIWAH